LSGLTVVKVGGSLFDLPELGPRLLRWLTELTAADVLLVPGGGPTADAIRDLDQRHGLGQEKAHWLALRALTLNAHVLANLLPGFRVVESTAERLGGKAVLDPHAFCLADERDHPAAALAHSWTVTSDSIAARVAIASGARQLILLKSVTLPQEIDWPQAARQGFVDGAFADLVRGVAALQVRAINFCAQVG